MRAVSLMVVIVLGAITLVGALLALFAGNIGSAVVLFVVGSACGLLANKLAGAPEG